MATMTIEAGPYSSDVSIDNDRLLEFVRVLAWQEEDDSGIPAPTDQQELLDFFTMRVGQLVKREVKRIRSREIGAATNATLATEFADEWE